MSNLVYLVTAGEYSNYEVCSVHLNPAKAAKRVAEGKGDRVEVFTLDNAKTMGSTDRPLAWRDVYMDREGQVLEVKSDLNWDRTQAVIWPAGRDGCGQDVECLLATVLSASDKHAVKIVNGLRVAAIGLGLWSNLKREVHLVDDDWESKIPQEFIASMVSGIE